MAVVTSYSLIWDGYMLYRSSNMRRRVFMNAEKPKWYTVPGILFAPVIKLWSFSFKPPFSTLWTLETTFLLCKLSYVFSSGNIGHDWETARLEEKEETYFLLNLCWFHIDFLFLWVPHVSPTNFYNLEAAGLFHCSNWMNYVILLTCS